MTWAQRYDPLGSPLLSTAVAALPIVALLGSLAWLRLRAHLAALVGLGAALAVAIAAVGMPAGMALRSAVLGAAYGLFPIGWIVLNVLFLYRLVEQRGLLDALRRGVAGVTDDRRLQLLLVAFSFGAFMEGAAGFGTPVAVTGGILIALGFGPLEASGLSLIANTAPVAFGALGTPIIALQGVTGLDLHALSAQVGHQLPVFSLIVPFWLVWAYAGWRRTLEVWPAVLVAGVSFAVPQFLVSTLHGPWLVDIVAAACSMGALVLFLRVWKPGGTATQREAAAAEREAVGSSSAHWASPDVFGGTPVATPSGARREPATSAEPTATPRLAWAPWIVLTTLVFLWGLPAVKNLLNGMSAPKLQLAGLHNLIERVPPVVAAAAAEPAVFTLNWLSATGSSILLAALITAAFLGYGLRELGRTWLGALRLARHSLLTIALMLAIGYLCRYAGLDAILGLAFARSGLLYPFFGTLLGWLGVALTGSDTSSNVLFGSLQTITARQLGLDPTLMAAANSSGGVMGKMIDAQSIVVASTVTRFEGHEGAILRYVFFHSVALAALVGLLVLFQAYGR
ncbi:MAG TPA: L-lactate permease [Gemmatimonadales bacterium]|jgi:lactate permease|nr:L-lactate permease [Gemmatimonadales bacterium]